MPDVVTYNALISTCEKGKQPEQGQEMLQVIRRQGLLHHIPNVWLNSMRLRLHQLLMQLLSDSLCVQQCRCRLPEVAHMPCMSALSDGSSNQQKMQ